MNARVIFRLGILCRETVSKFTRSYRSEYHNQRSPTVGLATLLKDVDGVRDRFRTERPVEPI